MILTCVEESQISQFAGVLTKIVNSAGEKGNPVDHYVRKIFSIAFPFASSSINLSR